MPAIEHIKECHGQLNWIHPGTTAVMPNMYKQKLYEALETNRLKTLNQTNKTFKVLNRDHGDCTTINRWEPLSGK